MNKSLSKTRKETNEEKKQDKWDLFDPEKWKNVVEKKDLGKKESKIGIQVIDVWRLATKMKERQRRKISGNNVV